MVKKILKTIAEFFSPSPNSLGYILDQYEPLGASRCPIPEKKKVIEEDFSI